MTPYRIAWLVGALVLACPAGGNARAGTAHTYVLDPVHTQLVFFADHLGFSHAIGRLKVLSGWFQLDAEDWSTARADVVIDMRSLDMGDAAWTEKVASPQFLHTGKWPSARFIGRRLERGSDNTGILHGELWLRGVRRDIDLEVTFNRLGGDPYAFKTKAGFTARGQLDRFDFGMDTYREVVGAAVELRIEVEGVRSRKEPVETRTDVTEKH
jgi:polyisoprenoid-binding protein YceI